jgi:hypothetical protein
MREFVMLRLVSKPTGDTIEASEGGIGRVANCWPNMPGGQTGRCGSTSRAGPRRVAMPRGPAVALAVVLLLAGLALQTGQAGAAEAVQTFGPGKVNCQALAGTQVDCLLAADRVTQGNRNVATFGVTALPRRDQALFRKWCLAAANECTVTVTGLRDSPDSSRLSTVTSVHWTRLSAPMNEAAARAAQKALATDATGPAAR